MNATGLQAATHATAYQKKWFHNLRSEAIQGRPYALVNADTPHELLRAMDVPYIVSQWWASIVAAKRMAPRCLQALRENGYPDDVQQYDAIPFGSYLLGASEELWGGLPQPAMAIAENSGDATRKVFNLWSDIPGTEVFTFERTAADPAPLRWWDLVPHRWEEAFGSARLDLMVAEQQALIERLENLTGRKFSMDRLSEIMQRANRQAELNRSTRDLIAASRPHRFKLAQGISAVMIPQWHRGSEWGVEAAAKLNDEVRELISDDAPVQPGHTEKLRLMWIGRGIWGDLDLYNHFEEAYGAVFVWSMYLAIAADGYARYGDDDLRALAARFVGLTDQLYAPPWSADWYLKEARHHGVDGVIHLVSDDIAGSHFTTSTLEEAGIPVLVINGSNTDTRRLDPETIRAKISEFIEKRLANG